MFNDYIKNTGGSGKDEDYMYEWVVFCIICVYS